ncbi:F0F1 ATP synthase subunit delta [Tissierella sp. Yu-01]|uniref:F0F1 ATP synthase subunit delta n=1 Tax=Tissierella sp. Yu-01 TaxID=3035694 RepID=UPI00240E2224|nr:F0F1 ATP synthase subunit delta [Tissierella sp. Yu-01]WFA08155.1 F0F1 ATP synthase subunit delta [Tissierella sp. Yu-01]
MAKLNKRIDYTLASDFSLIDASLELYKKADSQKELDFVKEILEKETEFVDLLMNPDIKENEKRSLIDNTFKDNVSEQMLILLKKLFLKYTDVVTVTAITAVPMDEHAQEKLSKVLYEKLNKDVMLINEVDTSIIGGVLLKVGDKIMDATLGNELRSISKTLKEVSL